MTAIEYLKQIRKLEDIICNKLIEYRHWVEVAEGMGGYSDGDKVQTTRNLNLIPNAIGNYIDLETEIKELRQRRAKIIKTIESLPNQEYNVIYRLFVEGLTMKETAYELNRSYDWVKLKKRSALRRIQDMLNEKGANH